MTAPHVPVLVKEVLALFEKKEIRTFVDGTLGAGGHARAILEEHPEIETYIGCDRDPDALEIARKELLAWKGKVRIIHGNYGNVLELLEEAGRSCTDGMLIDAGVSSMQFDRAERGFSFQTMSPLDMRMNPEAELTAEEIVNHTKEKELEQILREYGEEPRARAIARAIVAARKKKRIRTTGDLLDVIRPIAKGRKHLHPATLTFQAIRIAVNDELNALKKGVEEGIKALCPTGRMAVISFHRLEDRIVKVGFKESDVLKVLTKKPIVPTELETRKNPRSRSAKLRAAEKCEE
jgi:16S rRNA (cytosine1402-N4)-methyltransferase